MFGMCWHTLLLCWGVPGTMVRSHTMPCSLKGPLSCMAPCRRLHYLAGFVVPKICCSLFPSVSSLCGS